MGGVSLTCTRGCQGQGQPRYRRPFVPSPFYAVDITAKSTDSGAGWAGCKCWLCHLIANSVS